MTDELTPEEKEALSSLPRQRMPAAGLEARVVDAMREHGFLAKRRRTIELTRGRTAGVLAAGVALLIGAYSIGLHRGDSREVLLPSAPATVRENEGRLNEGAAQMPPAERRVRAEEPSTPTKEASKPSTIQESRDAARSDADHKDATESPMQASPPAPERQEAAAEEARPTQRETDAVVSTEKKQKHAAPANQPPAAFTQSSGRAESTKLQDYAAAAPAPKQKLTFLINGTPVTVEADSVRVTENEQGRILIIYTREGVFRIPLADE